MISEVATYNIHFNHEGKKLKLRITTLLVITLVLVACNKAPSPESKTIKSLDETKLLITKRWIQNPGHCLGTLDERITDYTFNDQGVITSGILAKGSYSLIEDTDMAQLFVQYLVNNVNCKSSIPDPDAEITMIKFASYEQEYLFAFFPEHNFILRLVENEVFPVVLFEKDSEYLKGLNYAD